MACVLKDFGLPQVDDVLEAVIVVKREANQDDVGIGIAKRSKAIKVFLASGIPQGELDSGITRWQPNVLHVRIKYRGDMCLVKLALLKYSTKASD